MQLSIVLVHYKTLDLTLASIDSIYQHTNSLDFEIIVVDNDSKDSLQQNLVKKYPEIKYIDMGYNSGFSRANNAGMDISKGDVILMLNTDTIIEDNSLSDAYFRLIKDEQTSAAGVQLYSSEKVKQQSGSFFVLGGLNFLMMLPIWGNVLAAVAKRFTTIKTHEGSTENLKEYQVDWISGAFIMVKRNAIDKIGKFDDDFFLYAEEVEWCQRIGKVGKLKIYPDLSCIHLEGESSKKESGWEKGYSNYLTPKGKQIMVSNLLSIRKRLGVGWFLIHFINLLIPVILLFFRSIFQFNFSDFKAYLKNIGVVAKHFFKILLLKKYFYRVI